ncbi:hypothetical protein CerSpe_150520 [Prunus speciosa]
MASQIKFEIIERQTVKPSSPTPHHLRNYELSHFDQNALFKSTSRSFSSIQMLMLLLTMKDMSASTAILK